MRTGIDWAQLRLKPSRTNLIILAALLTAAAFLIQGNVGLNLADEGFIWYGTARTAMGEVPLRDFQSYDPGRYYWGALWLKAIGSNGIIALRVSQALFQFLGLSLALLLLRRVVSSWLALIVSSGILVLWLFVPWKIYEPVITIAAVYFAVLLIESPSNIRHFLAGVFVGGAAFFGRNHGVYCFAAFLLLILYIWWTRDRGPLAIRIALWGLGILAGYSPMLLMLLVVPGFFASFTKEIFATVQHGTNLPLPVPWPWAPEYSRLNFRQSLQAFSEGVVFLCLPLFYLAGFILVLFRRRMRLSPVFIGCIFVGVAYLHYTFDRAQLYYLAWTIPPFILGVIALTKQFTGPYRKPAVAIVWALLVGLSWTALDQAPDTYFLSKPRAWIKTKLPGGRGRTLAEAMRDYDLEETKLNGDQLWISPATKNFISAIESIDHRLVPKDENLLIAPHETALYPILQKRSPLREIYFLFPIPLARQQEMTDELQRKKVNWAIICSEVRVDRNNDLNFRTTDNYVWAYLSANFESVQADGIGPSCELLHRRIPAN
jgi:hypothetical protein